MGKHVHEHVQLDIDSAQLGVETDATEEEKLQALIAAFEDNEDIEIEVNTESEVIEE